MKMLKIQEPTPAPVLEKMLERFRDEFQDDVNAEVEALAEAIFKNGDIGLDTLLEFYKTLKEGCDRIAKTYVNELTAPIGAHIRYLSAFDYWAVFFDDVPQLAGFKTRDDAEIAKSELMKEKRA